jgi:hypothetical protein
MVERVERVERVEKVEGLRMVEDENGDRNKKRCTDEQLNISTTQQFNLGWRCHQSLCRIRAK